MSKPGNRTAAKGRFPGAQKEQKFRQYYSNELEPFIQVTVTVINSSTILKSAKTHICRLHSPETQNNMHSEIYEEEQYYKVN